MLGSSRCFCILCAIVAGILALLAFLVKPQAAHAQDKPVSFVNDVAPILKENCFACHDAKKRSGKLDMTTFEKFMQGGQSDSPVAAGKPDESYLLELVAAEGGKRMPPEGKGQHLTKEQISAIERWIRQGAKLDAGLDPKADLVRELRLHWKPPAPPAAYPYPAIVNALAFTPDNKQIVVGGQHELTVWDVNSAKLEKRIYTRAERAYGVVFLSDGKLVVAGGRPGQEGDVRVYDINGPAKTENGVAILNGVDDPKVMLKQMLDADDSILALALSPDGKKLAAGGCDRIVRVWDVSGGYASAKLEQSIENHADWILGIALAADDKHLLTASRDKTAKVWDLAAKESVMTFPDHQNPVYAVAVKADGKVGYSAGDDKQLRTWNAVADGKQVKAIGGHGDAILKLVAHPKQPLLITASADKTVRVWNADSGAAVRTLNGLNDQVFALAISPDGNLVAAGSYAGEVSIWKVADGAVVKSFIASPGYVKK
ncbi:MAG TPA: c-type cytochrome domain-containing protein [Gemmataceae bacterium]|nr:c-type cytochrome domain-containing protein [Gemmataceae bacterium]